MKNIWGKVFKNGPSKICLPQILPGLFLKTLSHMENSMKTLSQSYG